MDIVGMANVLDIMVVSVLLICIAVGFHRGFLRSIIHLFSVVIALFVSKFFYDDVAKFLSAHTTLDEMFTAHFTKALGLDGLIEQATIKAQAEIINALPVPDFITKMLLTNNNDALYEVLDADKLEGYISSFLSNICMNVIAMVLVFTATLIILKIISKLARVVDYLPVIKHFNRLGGAITGFVIGSVIIWFSMTILTFLFLRPTSELIWTMLEESNFAIWFYTHNLIMDVISKITT